MIEASQAPKGLEGLGFGEGLLPSPADWKLIGERRELPNPLTFCLFCATIKHILGHHKMREMGNYYYYSIRNIIAILAAAAMDELQRDGSTSRAIRVPVPQSRRLCNHYCMPIAKVYDAQVYFHVGLTLLTRAVLRREDRAILL